MMPNPIFTAQFMRLLLLGCLLLMVFQAAFFLRTRKLSLLEYIGWGIVALVLPVVGPFLVIWIRPGTKNAAR